jgi:hypothetical protein
VRLWINAVDREGAPRDALFIEERQQVIPPAVRTVGLLDCPGDALPNSTPMLKPVGDALVAALR